MRVLAGDIGGTKTLLRVAEFNTPSSGEPGRTLAEQSFDSLRFSSLAEMVQEFGKSHGITDLRCGCFGVAGPVEGDPNRQIARLTNLPWELDSARLQAELNLPRVRLINDFQAIGYGIDGLQPEELITLQEAPATRHGPRLIIGAGTGLGVALLFWTGDHYEAHPTEAGHVGFAPQSAEQDGLLAYLRAQFDHVSCERVVSGPGLEAIYNFLLSREPHPDSEMPRPGVAAAISAAAEDGSDPVAGRALDLFVSIYGAVAGNLALTCLAHGGVFVAGGIAPKILGWLQGGRFVEAFNAKGRMSFLTRTMPVQVVTNPKVGLIGAAMAASRLY